VSEPRPVPRLRAVVLEDEWSARNYLIELLEASGLAQVVGAVSDVEQARDLLATESGIPIDVMFVDLHLVADGEEAGLELVRAQARLPNAPMFVLATASQEHALEAFDLGVVDYLRKPFTQDRVTQCLARLSERRPPPTSRIAPPPRIVARRKKSLVFLRPEEVWAFEAADRLASVHATFGKFEIDLSLSAIEASVGKTFLRVHRNWLVNIEHVREIARDEGESNLVVGPGVGYPHSMLKVPMARERAQAVRELLLENTTGVRKG